MNKSGEDALRLAFNKLEDQLKESKKKEQMLRDALKKSVSLLNESLDHLDRDYNWEDSDEFEEKVKKHIDTIKTKKLL